MKKTVFIKHTALSARKIPISVCKVFMQTNTSGPHASVSYNSSVMLLKVTNRNSSLDWNTQLNLHTNICQQLCKNCVVTYHFKFQWFCVFYVYFEHFLFLPFIFSAFSMYVCCYLKVIEEIKNAIRGNENKYFRANDKNILGELMTFFFFFWT